MADDFQAIIDAARQGVAPSPVARDASLLYFPTDGGVVYSAEGHLPTPLRKRGTVTVFDVNSFNQVIAANGDAGNIAVYVDRDVNKPAIVGVLNGSGVSGAGWSDFRVEIAFRESPQWKKWREIDGRLLPQTDFAEFVEENLADIIDPDGATALEITTNLQATRTANFRSDIKLSSGAFQFQNSEDTEAKVGAGLIAVPAVFKLGIQPWLGSVPFIIDARFRYRLKDGKLTLGVKLTRIEDLVATLVGDAIEKIVVPEGVPILEGIAPTSTPLLC